MHSIRSIRIFFRFEQPFAGLDIEQDIFKAFVGWAWDKLFRTKFVRETGLQFQEQRTSNDMYFVFCSIIKAKSIETMNAVMAHHRRDGRLFICYP